MPVDRRRLAWILLFLSPAFFGVNILMARYAVFVPPNALALGRWLLVALILLPLVWPNLRRHPDAIAREWPDLLLFGALGMWVCGAFVYIGGHTTQALNIGLIYATAPILVVVLGRVIDQEKLTATRITGIALCLAGTLTVIVKGDVGNLLAVRFTVGDLWAAIAAACWGLYSILLKHRPSRLDPLPRLCLIAFAGSLVLIPFTIGEALLWGGPDLGDWNTWAAWLLLALVPGVLAYGSYSFCVKELGPSATSISLYLGPLYVGLMAWATLGEAPHWYHLLGLLLVLPGLFLATRLPP
ncbi:MAG: DMT family transporter [Enhydrobacter sp.]|nr:MAG: DMT family transporter [Enhydrobacter sp.]